jgi:hypothetical protein
VEIVKVFCKSRRTLVHACTSIFLPNVKRLPFEIVCVCPVVHVCVTSSAATSSTITVRRATSTHLSGPPYHALLKWWGDVRIERLLRNHVNVLAWRLSRPAGWTHTVNVDRVILLSMEIKSSKTSLSGAVRTLDTSFTRIIDSPSICPSLPWASTHVHVGGRPGLDWIPCSCSCCGLRASHPLP